MRPRAPMVLVDGEYLCPECVVENLKLVEHETAELVEAMNDEAPVHRLHLQWAGLGSEHPSPGSLELCGHCHKKIRGCESLYRSPR